MYFIDITPGQTDQCFSLVSVFIIRFYSNLGRSADIRLFANVNQDRNYAKVNLLVGGLKVEFRLIRFHG